MKPDNIRENGERNDDNFIMLPTVDICFKNLMENPEVRRGFIAALQFYNASYCGFLL